MQCEAGGGGPREVHPTAPFKEHPLPCALGWNKVGQHGVKGADRENSSLSSFGVSMRTDLCSSYPNP